MAATAGSSLTIASICFKPNQAFNRFSSSNTVSVSFNSRSFPSLKVKALAYVAQARFARQIAKPETVEKVCSIVRKQLALADDAAVTGESKFAALGADSLDTVEIVMGLEEEFGISVEEESAQSIATVQDAADLIEKLISA
ncbi:hypothetical protein Leryth_024636 [Lithospermum erythrorhizon]|nr:hypothetical protein Leryth_024636 [Lithospermum erythrorhizon]